MTWTLTPVLFVIALALQSTTLDHALDDLGARARGSQFSDARDLVTKFDTNPLIDSLLARLRTDPAYARGTRAANVAVRALASTRDEGGAVIYIGRPEQVAALADALLWAEDGTKLEILQNFSRIDPSLRPTMAASVSGLLMHHPIAPVALKAMEAIVIGNLDVPEASLGVIRDVALRKNLEAPLWQAAQAWDRELQAGSRMQSDLHMSAIAAYLTIGDDLLTVWREFAAGREAHTEAAIYGCLHAAIALANRGNIEVELEQQIFDTTVVVSAEPAAHAALECCAVGLLASGLEKAVADRDAIARGLVRLVSESMNISPQARESAARVLDAEGFTDLASQVPR